MTPRTAILAAPRLHGGRASVPSPRGSTRNTVFDRARDQPAKTTRGCSAASARVLPCSSAASLSLLDQIERIEHVPRLDLRGTAAPFEHLVLVRPAQQSSTTGSETRGDASDAGIVELQRPCE